MFKFSVAVVLMLASVWAQAQSAISTTPKPVRPTLKTKPVVYKPVPKPIVATHPGIHMDLSPEELAVADRVVVGAIPCDMEAHVLLTKHTQITGHFVLQLGREKYAMVPVATTTGAIRLEDAKSGAVWLQLANKSMLMNQKLGKRLADSCMNADQIRVARSMELAPGPGLLEPLEAPNPRTIATN